MKARATAKSAKTPPNDTVIMKTIRAFSPRTVAPARIVPLAIAFVACAGLLFAAASAQACACGKGCTNVCAALEKAKAHVLVESKLNLFLADQKFAARRYLRLTWLESEKKVIVEGFIPSRTLGDSVSKLVAAAVKNDYAIETNFSVVPSLGQPPSRTTYVSEAAADSVLSGRVRHSLRGPDVQGLMARLGAEILTWDVLAGHVTLFVVQDSKNVPERQLAESLQPHLKDIKGLRQATFQILPSRKP